MKNPTIALGWQTAPDEATLYTDADSLRGFANDLLAYADRLEEEKEVQVEKLIVHSLSEVRIDWISLVKDEEELIARIQEHQ